MSHPATARFWSKVNRSLGCWEWGAATDGPDYPYGKFWVDGHNVGAHRFAYELVLGAIPKGLHLDHLCRNPRCVNPAHLEPVTVRENLMRSPLAPATQNACKTHCIRGHAFDEVNTYIKPNGARRCRKCTNADMARYRAAKRAA